MPGSDNPYARIYKDLLVIKDFTDNQVEPNAPKFYLMSEFWNPFSDKSNLHEKRDKYWEQVSNKCQSLIDKKKINTCQGIGLMLKMVETTKKKSDLAVYTGKFHQIEDPDTGLNLEKLLRDVKNLSEGRSTQYYSKQKINLTLENWKGHSDKYCLQSLIPDEIIKPFKKEISPISSTSGIVEINSGRNQSSRYV